MVAISPNRLSARSDRAGFFTRVIDAMTLWNDARQTRKRLERLSDRELNDIGLSRFDIDMIGR